MEILGVGPLELLFIFLIALIVLGPKDMAKTGRTLGRFMYKVVTSPAWQTFRQASRDLRQLPTKLMREAGLEEQELQKLSHEIGLKDNFPVSRQDLSLSSWTTAPTDTADPLTPPNVIAGLEGQAATVEPVQETDNLVADPDTTDVIKNPMGDEGTPEGVKAIPSKSEPPPMSEDQVPAQDDPLMKHPSELDQTQQSETP